MKIIISGGRGFIGRNLVAVLAEAGHEVFIWTRKPQEELRAGVGAYFWDPMAGPPQAESLEGMDAVVHLAGEPVAQRWSDEVKRKIHDSRVVGTRNLVAGLSRVPDRPPVFVCASATGIYGDRGEEELTEQSTPGSGFLSQVCLDWEREAMAAEELGIRVARIRTGIAIGRDGGVTARMLTAFRAGVGGQLASGKQWMSWIHIRDLVALFRFAAERPVSGALNGAAPNPVRNEQFTEALAKALHRPAAFHIPELALKVMFGEMAGVLVESQRVLPKAALDNGFVFQFPEIFAAMADAVRAQHS